MRNPRIVRQTWNLRNEQRDPRIEQIPGLRVTYIYTMKTPSKFLVTGFKLLCVNITVLTGIDVDLDSDCHNHYLGSQFLCSSLQKSPPIS